MRRCHRSQRAFPWVPQSPQSRGVSEGLPLSLRVAGPLRGAGVAAGHPPATGPQTPALLRGSSHPGPTTGSEQEPGSELSAVEGKAEGSAAGDLARSWGPGQAFWREAQRGVRGVKGERSACPTKTAACARTTKWGKTCLLEKLAGE